MEYNRTKYASEDGTSYEYRDIEEPIVTFSPALQSIEERLNLIALILRDYADTMHNNPERSNDEAECRALAHWVDTIVFVPTPPPPTRITNHD